MQLLVMPANVVRSSLQLAMGVLNVGVSLLGFIAHRTLPCGALVTVSHRNRKVTVRVIDRGPYSGATVDLTERTKQFLRFQSGSVGMTRVERFRVLAR